MPRRTAVDDDDDDDVAAAAGVVDGAGAFCVDELVALDFDFSLGNESMICRISSATPARNAGAGVGLDKLDVADDDATLTSGDDVSANECAYNFFSLYY